MKEVLVSTVGEVSEVLRSPNLAQALYDEGAVIMDRVLLTLHGDEHRKRRMLEFRVFRRDFFRYYETEVFPRTLERDDGGRAGRRESRSGRPRLSRDHEPHGGFRR